MSGAETNHTTPPVIRVSASQVPQLLGLTYSRSSRDVLQMLKRQLNGAISETKPSMVSTEDYWSLVGLVRDNYTQTSEQHISMIKAFLERDETEHWYKKLFDSLWRTVGVTIHSETLEPQKKSFEVNLTPNIVLAGIPDGLDEASETVVELKTRKKDEFLESDKVQLYCYLKLTGYKNGILRVKTPDMLVEKMYTWDEEYWKKIERTLVAMLEWVENH